MVIATGARGYVAYEFEDTFGALLNAGNGSTGEYPNKRFGLQEKITSWTLNNNRIVLPTLNKTEPESFAYGQEMGTLGIDFILSNPWFFGTLYGAPTPSGSSSDFTHTYASPATTATKDVRSFRTEIGLDLGTDIVRTMKGCICRTFNISTTVGGIVQCSADIAYSMEDAPTSTLGTAPVDRANGVAGAQPTLPATKFPYTFAHATLKLNNAVVAKIQRVDINFNQNPDLLWGIGSHQAVEAYRRVFEITGTFEASWVDKTLLDDVLAQVAIPNDAARAEVLDGSAPALELNFTNGLGTTDEKRIQITLTGVSPTEHSVSGLEPVEPVFENITWQAKSCIVKAYNSESTEP
tara:strand:+ start:1306 stop:2358 length:1053 start_codon:yes stop_codon:yes gene_type:complete